MYAAVVKLMAKNVPPNPMKDINAVKVTIDKFKNKITVSTVDNS